MKTPARFCLATGFILLCLALPLRADYSNTVASFNPLGYWRLNETVSSPAPNVATNSGSLGSPADGWPYPGLALTFAQPGVIGNSVTISNNTAGANAWDAGAVIDVPYNAALNPNGPFTIEFWGNPSTLNRHDADILVAVSSMNTGDSRSGWLMYHNTGGSAGDNNWEFRIGGTAGYSYTLSSPTDSGLAGVWTHVVGVYDGTFAYLYVNGRLVTGPTAITAGRNFNPNKAKPFRIGAWDGSGFGRHFDGSLDEVALYGTALAANSISNHYFMGTNNPAGYAALVLADAPVGYWHLDEPVYVPPAQSTLPVTANSGSLGAAADGTNQPGLTAGVNGPQGSGFPANNRAVQGKYAAGNVHLGNPPGLNFSGQITLIAWVKPGYTTDLRNIVSHGFQTTDLVGNPVNAEVQLRINGGLYQVGSWNGTGEGADSAAGRAATDAGNWVFLAGTYDGTDWRLYRYDQLIGGPVPGPTVGGALTMDAPWSIGSRGDTTTDGRFIGGAVDEVAIFNTALSQAQIQQIFYSAQMSPVILAAPQAPVGTIYEGANLSFSVEAAGNPTLLYQWTKDSAPLPGQTGTTLALNNVTTTSSGNYAIVVTNNYGSITSSFAVTVISGPPLITQQPADVSRYVSRSATFSVAAVGSPPISYQWFFNTNTSIGGATASSYTKNNLQPADSGKYNCLLTNPNGTSNSAYATLTVLPTPTTPYPVAALADNPIGYWRLGESSGTVANDYWGGRHGKYNSVTLAQPGYSPLDPNTAASFGAANRYVGEIGGIDFAGASSTFTLEVWVKGSPVQVAGTDANATIIGKGRGGDGAGGVNGWQFALEVAGGKYQLKVESGSEIKTAVADLGPNNTWQHVVATYDQVGGAMQMYVNGQPSGVIGTPPAAGPLASSIPVSIGAGQGGVGPAYDMYFNGLIDEVAIYNTSLSPSQVEAHYCAQFGPGQAPLFASQPASVTEWVGWPITLSGTVAGSCTLTYQWYKGATPVSDSATISGSQSSLLTISALSLADAGNYTLRAQNSSGTSNSAVAVVTVLSTPTADIPISGLVMHHKFDNNLTDATGRGNNGTAVGGPTYETGVFGQALHYSTEVGPPFSSKYATLGVRPDLQFSNNVSFSVALWIKLPANSLQGDLPYLCSALNSYGNPGLTFAPSYQLGGWSYYLGSSSGNVGLYSPDYVINDGNFHHLVHSFNRTGQAVTYLDGVQVDARGITTVGNVSNGRPLNIGQDPSGAYPETGEGWIDDLGVWRKALTALEARGLYVAATNGFSFVGVPPTFTWEVLPGGNLKLTWDPGTLTQADDVTGPYTDVAGATSPYTVTISPTTAKKYYKLR